ncbi:GDSL-type esterase/lipase family protein [Lacrimispora sp. HJ1]|uniref:GDSL-type esterase/lipase family protein n=2 Tax=unclassified Lacrimispora TaxID=2719232 RepID=UPI00376F6989
MYEKVKQYDNLSRKYRIMITDKGNMVSLKGNEAIRLRMWADGESTPYIDKWLDNPWEDGYPILIFTANMLSKIGKVKFEFVIQEPGSPAVISTRQQNLLIQKSLINYDGLISSDDFDVLSNLITQAITIPDLINDINVSLDDVSKKISEVNSTMAEYDQQMQTYYTEFGEMSANVQDLLDAVHTYMLNVENAAASSARLSESWAVGGTNSREGENIDNAKYHSEQSKLYSDEAEASADRAEQYAGNVDPKILSQIKAIDSSGLIGTPGLVVVSQDLVDKISTNVKMLNVSTSKVNSDLAQKASQVSFSALETEVNSLVLGAVGNGNNAEVIQSRGIFQLVNDRFGILENALTSQQNFGYVNLGDANFSSGWARVVTTKIPITKNGKIVVVFKAYGSTCFIQHIRRKPTDYNIVDVVKTIAVNTIDSNICSMLCDFDIDTSGNDFIAMSGCYINTNSITYGYRQLSSSFNIDTTSYSGFGTNNTMTADMGFYIFVLNNKVKLLDGLQGICMGDSITEYGTYPKTMTNLTGCNFLNCGIGGTRYSYRTSDPLNAFSFVKLAYTIANGDWTEVFKNTSGLSAQGLENLWRMYRTDWSKVNILTLSFGTNDWNGGVPLDDETGHTISTILGSIRQGIEYLLSAFPQLQIYIFTPAFRSRRSVGDGLNSDDNANNNGLYLFDLCNEICNVADEYHIPSKNMYKCSLVNKQTATYYLSDGLHRTDVGYELLGNQYARMILGYN